LEHGWFWGIKCTKSDHVPDQIQIENYDLGCPKSKFRFGDIPNQIRNKVVFGLQHDHLTNHLFNQKKKS
jgi:hypothetical protein